MTTRTVVENPGTIYVDPQTLSSSAHFVCHVYIPLKAVLESRSVLDKEEKKALIRQLAHEIGESILGSIADEEGNL